jgi:hypothetical protein
VNNEARLNNTSSRIRCITSGIEASSSFVYEAWAELNVSASSSLAALSIVARYATLGCGVFELRSSMNASLKGRHSPSGESGGIAKGSRS